MRSLLFFVISFFCWAQAWAESAEPIVDLPKSQLNLQVRSDLWTAIYDNKDTPVRIYDIDYQQKILNQDRWKLNFLAGIDGFSTGRTDLVVGPQSVLIGSDIRDQLAGFRMLYLSPDKSGLIFNISYESASDQPFQNNRDIWFETDITYEWAPQENHQYFLEFNESKNRGYLNGQPILLPGIKFSDGPDWLYSISLASIKVVRFLTKDQRLNLQIEPLESRLRYQRSLPDNCFYTVDIGVKSRAWLNVTRIEDDMRLYFQETYIQNGYRINLSPKADLKFTVGYSFDRFLYEAKQVYLPVGHHSTMPSDWFGTFRWEYYL